VSPRGNHFDGATHFKVGWILAVPPREGWARAKPGAPATVEDTFEVVLHAAAS